MKKMDKIKTKNEEELKKVALGFSQKLKPKDIVFLKGELGSGKTTFVKGVGEGLGIKKLITSPTFQVVKEYEKILCHIDAYRIYNEDIGIEDYIQNNYIVFIEWPDNLCKSIIPNYLIKIKYLEDGREIEIEEYERS